MADREYGFRTRAIHAGNIPDEVTGARALPIYQTSAFVFDDTADAAARFALQKYGNIYSRLANPTVASFEERVASLEGGLGAVATASGLGAQFITFASLVGAGDHVVSSANLYGGSITQLDITLRRFGVDTTFVRSADPADYAAAITDKTKFIFAETIANPSGEIADIEGLADVAHAHHIPLIIDSTVATPYLNRPIEWGADVVVHSTTKYLGGHSDVVGGAVVLNDEELAAKVGFVQFGVGAVSGPMDAWLTVRGIKTLAVRLDRHSSNAQALAERLVGHPKLEAVYYPGLPSHPGHELAARQMKSFGGMISVAVAGGAARAKKFAESTTVFQLAESLGGVESLIGYPAEMTHASVKGTALEVPDNVVRLSVGIEDERDLIDDVLGALDRL